MLLWHLLTTNFNMILTVGKMKDSLRCPASSIFPSLCMNPAEVSRSCHGIVSICMSWRKSGPNARCWDLRVCSADWPSTPCASAALIAASLGINSVTALTQLCYHMLHFVPILMTTVQAIGVACSLTWEDLYDSLSLSSFTFLFPRNISLNWWWNSYYEIRQNHMKSRDVTPSLSVHFLLDVLKSRSAPRYYLKPMDGSGEVTPEVPS